MAIGGNKFTALIIETGISFAALDGKTTYEVLMSILNSLLIIPAWCGGLRMRKTTITIPIYMRPS